MTLYEYILPTAANKTFKIGAHNTLYATKKLQEENASRVVGCIYLSSTPKKVEQIASVNLALSGLNKKMKVYKDIPKHPSGYLQLSSGDFIAVVEGSNLPIIIAVVCVLAAVTVGGGFIFLFNNPSSPANSAPIMADGSIFDGDIDTGKKEQQENTIVIPGYSNIYVAKGQKVDLVNPENNTVLFKYTITEGDNTVYETDYIKPGEKVEWVAVDDLKTSGQHTLVFSISTIDSTDYTPCNGATINVTATVE